MMTTKIFTNNMLLRYLNSHICRYLMVGGSNTLLSLALYYAMLKLGINYLVANAICFIVGVIVGYSLNARFVFKTKWSFIALRKYLYVYGMSLSLNLLLLYSLVDYLHFSAMIAQIITTAIMTILNYLMIKAMIFKR